MERKLPADNEELHRRPVVIRFKNAAFCHHISEGRRFEEGARCFILNPINGEIKKVSEAENSTAELIRKFFFSKKQEPKPENCRFSQFFLELG